MKKTEFVVEYLGWIPALLLMFWGFIFALYVIGKELNLEKKMRQLEWKKNGEKETQIRYLLYSQ